jgi:hypothetical protein
MNLTLTTEEEQERPEPFATICELIERHGIREVLHAVSDYTLFESEDAEDVCEGCRAEAQGFHEGLEGLLG